MKPARIAIIAGIAAVAAIAILLTVQSANPLLFKTYSSGDFRVEILQDNPSRFVARLYNDGPTQSYAVAFAVKKSYTDSCEPQGMVVSNFTVAEYGGDLYPEPNVLESGSFVEIDSRQANQANLVAQDVQTAVYVMRMAPASIEVLGPIEKIPVQEFSTSELELFEQCVQANDKGYPLLFMISNPTIGTQTFITITDSSGKVYETRLYVDETAYSLKETYWPNSSESWFSNNFVRTMGPSPWFKEPGEELTIHVRTEIESESKEFTATVVLTPEHLKEIEPDFATAAAGYASPVYPKFWEIPIDMQALVRLGQSQ